MQLHPLYLMVTAQASENVVDALIRRLREPFPQFGWLQTDQELKTQTAYVATL